MSEKWFSMRTDFFGQDAHMLGIYELSARAIGAYIACVAHACRLEVADAHEGVVRRAIGERSRPVIKELVEHGFLIPGDTPRRFRVAHEGTLWRRGQPQQRKAIPADVRQFVMQRDGTACVLCGSTDSPTLDHIWPWSKGGTHEPTNLRVLCRSCNSSKGDRT